MEKTILRNSVLALIITAVIIGTILYAVNYLDTLRTKELRTIEEELATDTLSLETQFSLLEEAVCEDIDASNILSQELSGLGDRLAFTEERLGSDHPEVVRIKERYTLLQIRDYLLARRIETSCGENSAIVLYFYGNTDCPDCARAGYALSYLKQTYPDLRVYSFDYNLDVGALKTLIAIEDVNSTLPGFVIERKNSYGFTDLEDLTNRFPEGLLEELAQEKATTTPTR